MPLNLAEFEKTYTIGKICGPEKQRHYLESLGFTAGGKIRVLSELYGYYIVMVKESRIGIEKKMACGIILVAE
mgnify:FL=1